MSSNIYTQYYHVQAGAGIENIGPTYYRNRYLQSGRGFGNIFSSLIKWFKPIAAKIWPVVRTNLGNMASGLINDMGQKPFTESFRQNASDVIRNVVSGVRQAGSGLRRKCIKRMSKKKKNSTSKVRSKTIKKKPKQKKPLKTRILDIFTNRS